MRRHTCRRDGKLLSDAMDWPAFARPGEVVKVADEDHWGRVIMLHGCCTTADVEFAGFGDREPGIAPMSPDRLESVHRDTRNSIPRGYPLPGRPGPKPGARQSRRAPARV